MTKNEDNVLIPSVPERKDAFSAPVEGKCP